MIQAESQRNQEYIQLKQEKELELTSLKGMYHEYCCS